jgi:hypothetical protein
MPDRWCSGGHGRHFAMSAPDLDLISGLSPAAGNAIVRLKR